MTGRPARAPDAPGAVPGPASGRRPRCPPRGPPPRGPPRLQRGPDPAAAFLGSGCGTWWVVPGFPSRTSIPEPSTTRKAWLSVLLACRSRQLSGFCLFLFWFCFALFFFFKKNKTFQNKVDNFFFFNCGINSVTVTFSEVRNLTLM